MKAFGLGFFAACAMLAASQPAARADCQCLANGREFEHGELTCIRLPTATFLARCDKVLNNSSWKKVRDGCPEAAAQQPEDSSGTVPAPLVTSALPLIRPSGTLSP